MTRQELAQKVKAKYPELQGVDDETVVASVLDQHPSYSAYLTDEDIGSNVVIESAKQFGLGAAETIGQAAEGAVLNLSLSMAQPTMSREEFFNSPESLKNVSYERYARLNDIKVAKQKKGMEFADAIKGWTEEKLPEYLNANEEYGNTFAGQVFRGLGQFLGYGTVGVAGTAIGSPAGGVAAVYGTAFFNRQIEFLEDAERTLGLDLTEMDKETRDKIVGGSWLYGLTTGALDATVFKYITRVPGANTPTVKNLLTNLVRGEAVPSGQLKTVLANTAKAALAEGTQESLGDGLTLDAIAKSLYDDDRELITGDALGRRVTEFALGGTVGGLGKTGIDLIRPAPRTKEDVQKLEEVLKKVSKSIEDTETEKQKFKIQFKQKASGETDIVPVEANTEEEALEIFNEKFKGMYTPDSGRIYTGEVDPQETVPTEEVVEEEVVEEKPKVLTQQELQLGARKFREQAQQAPVKQSDIAHEKTQRSNTIKTYDIINKSKYMPKDGKVLDFGAGLGEGAALMGAESFEPNPQAGFEPTYTNPDEIPSNSYDFVTSLSVLNVIPGRQIRDEVVKDIGRILKKNGKAVITARSDVDSYYKNKPELKTEEFGEVGYISGDRTYQKNFKQKELADYIQGVLGKGFKVTPLDVSVSGSSVLIEKIAEGTVEAIQEAVLATDEEELDLVQITNEESAPQGVTTDFLIVADDLVQTRDLRLSARKPKREDIPTISMDEFSGQRVFFYFSDWTRVGTYKGLDGNLNISLQGGPDYASTLLLYYIYEAAFMFWDTAYATTLSVVLILILCVIAIGQFFVLDKKVHYQ
jgi:SAM-dependent methyltransferase